MCKIPGCTALIELHVSIAVVFPVVYGFPKLTESVTNKYLHVVVV